MFLLKELMPGEDHFKKHEDLKFIPEFKVLSKMKSDTEKNLANQLLLYVAQVADFSSRYANLDFKTRQEVVCRDIFKRESLEDGVLFSKDSYKKVLDAIKKYDLLQKDAEYRALSSVNSHIDEINHILSESTSDISEVKQKSDIALRLDKLLEFREKLIASIEAKKGNKNLRGSITTSLLEDGTI